MGCILNMKDNSEKYNPKISVIISIYNVENYLRQCIDSVLSSTYENLEIVLVDDGSSDKCSAICDEYADKDSQIIVIHQENQGSVCARRNGVLHSTGQYISMIDGDDWVSSTLYEELANSLIDDSIDIFFCGYIEENGESSIKKNNSIESGIYEGNDLKIFKSRSLFDGTFYNPGVFPALWCKLFRRDFLLDIQYSVPSILKMGDDAAVTFSSVAEAAKVIVCNEIHGYHYRIRNESLSRSLDDIYFDRIHILCDYLHNIFDDHKEKELLDALMYYKLFLFKIGVEIILSGYKKIGVFNVVKKIRIGLKTIDIKSDWENIDEIMFPINDYRRLKYLSEGKVYCYLFDMLLEKINNSGVLQCIK